MVCVADTVSEGKSSPQQTEERLEQLSQELKEVMMNVSHVQADLNVVIETVMVIQTIEITKLTGTVTVEY